MYHLIEKENRSKEDHMKRKWMAGLLTAAVVMGLAGCGSGNKTEPAGTTAGEAAAETTKEAADQKEAEQEKVEL